MTFRLELVRGLFKPSIKAYQLKHSERIIGIIPTVFILIFINLVLAFLSSYLGFGSGNLTTKIYQLSPADFESYHLWQSLGSLIGSIIKPLLYIFTLALLFLAFYQEIPFKKLLALQLYILLIGIIEKLFLFLLQAFIGLTPTSAPFGLGVVGQILFDNSFLVLFLSALSLFLVWKIAYSLLFLRHLTEQTRTYFYSSIIGTYLFVILVDAAIKSIELYKFI